ncbi:CADM1 protein, partial [Polypterus senegalus]|nr:CADM1 protein [Polypterus senegalus]
MLCLLIILGRYFARHKGTYFTHEAKGADDAADADTAIINAEGGHNSTDDKKELHSVRAVSHTFVHFKGWGSAKFGLGLGQLYCSKLHHLTPL